MALINTLRGAIDLVKHAEFFTARNHTNTDTSQTLTEPTTSDEPELGDHLVSKRTGYTHHGIYSGDGKVIHYSGLADGLQSGAIEETTLEAFCNGRDFTIRRYTSPCFQGQDVIERARSRLEEDRYNLFSNNCEHFCAWCVNDEHSSEQVKRTKTATMTSIAGYTALRLITPPPLAAAISIGYGAYHLMQKPK